MSKLETSYEDLAPGQEILGGRGLSAKILNKEVPPNADPLGPEAKLVIATGPLAGTMAPSCGRISVGAKSPLTLGIKEANAGGPAGQKLDKLGIRAIIVEGSPADGQLYLLGVTRDGASLQEADQYKGMKNYDLAAEMGRVFNDKVSVISIGIAGERKWKSAAVSMSDKDGHMSRHAARGGLGAVMGSKGLKAIVLDDRGTAPVSLADRTAFQQAIRSWSEVVREDQGLQRFGKYGTPGAIGALRGLGSMPALNYGSNPLEGVERITGQAIEQINQERGGKMDGCMPGCLVRCSVVYNDAEGNYLTSSYEYETIALMGTNLGIVDPDVVARFDRICDDLGVDTIELGSAMGVAASAGKMKMGDAESAFKLLDEVEQGTEFGAVLGNGVVSTCQALGVDRIPAFKGQAIPAHDPRATKGTGVTYHTNPMGADHTAGITYEDPMSNQGQVERSLKVQIFCAMEDTVGYCTLAAPGDRSKLTAFLKDAVNARYGLDLQEEDLIKLGRETLRDELAFNEGTEIGTAHPTPDFIKTEKLAPTGNVFDVDPSEVNAIWDKLDTIAVL